MNLFFLVFVSSVVFELDNFLFKLLMIIFIKYGDIFYYDEVSVVIV